MQTKINFLSIMQVNFYHVKLFTKIEKACVHDSLFNTNSRGEEIQSVATVTKHFLKFLPRYTVEYERRPRMPKQKRIFVAFQSSFCSNKTNSKFNLLF